MGLTTGSGLTNRSDVIDTYMQHMIDAVATPPAGAGAVISRARSTGSVVSNNVEQWLEFPANRVSSGMLQTIGARAALSEANAIQHGFTYLDFTTASVGDTRAFDRMDGQPSNSPTEDNSSDFLVAPFSNGFNIQLPLGRHWIFTNPNFGALTTEYAAGEKTYLYMLIETAPNTYRIIGHCDVIQSGSWPTTQAGFYQVATYVQQRAAGQEGFGTSNQFIGGVNSRPGRTGDNVPGGGGSQGEASFIYQPDRDGMPRPYVIYDTFSFGTSNNVDQGVSNDPRYVGRDHNRTPSVYSGIALRTPIYMYGTRVTVAQKTGGFSSNDADLRFQLLAELPDAFYCNIRDLDPGTVFLDDGEKFLVAPLFEKGSGESGNFGVLIRNPGL